MVSEFRGDMDPSVREFAENVYDELVGHALGIAEPPQDDAVCRASSSKSF